MSVKPSIPQPELIARRGDNLKLEETAGSENGPCSGMRCATAAIRPIASLSSLSCLDWGVGDFERYGVLSLTSGKFSEFLVGYAVPSVVFLIIDK